MEYTKEDHLKFLQGVEESVQAVWVVAFYLYRKGWTVELEPPRKAPSHDEWKAFADKGDLRISRNGGGKKRVEVKRLGVDFTCGSDWPFGDKFIVCAKHSWDNANPKPLCHAITNHSMTYAGVVYCETQHLWYVEKKLDHRFADYRQAYYMCPVEQIKWIDLSR